MARMTAGRLRIRRAELGLTQAELATRADVSRQLIAAVEAGRNVPAVDAAIRIARALDTTVEAVFGPDTAPPVVPALGDPLPEGALLRLGRVGGCLVAAELPEHGVAGAGWARPDATITHGEIRILSGASPAQTVIAGCDPALGLAAALLADTGPRSLLAVHAPTGRALDALVAGTVHGISVHDRPDALPAPPVPVERRHLAQWWVGIAMPRSHPPAGLAGLLDGPIIQREAAASSQQALVRAAAASGRDVPPGPVAAGHLNAARLAEMTGLCALTTEPAARAFGLGFVPLEVHAVELWIDVRWLAMPGVAALLDLIAGDAFAERLEAVGGYDTSAARRPD